MLVQQHEERWLRERDWWDDVGNAGAADEDGGGDVLLAAASEEGADADSAASTAARQAATKAPPRVVAIHKGEGQVAGPGFASPEWVSGRLLALADGGLSFVWGEGLGMVTEMRRLRLP